MVYGITSNISESDVSVSDPKQEVDPEFPGWVKIVRRVSNGELVTVLDPCDYCYCIIRLAYSLTK